MIIIGMIGEYAMLFIHQYVKTNNKYRKESLQLNYWYVNNLYRRAMSQKLPVDGLDGLRIHPNLIKIL